MRILANSERTAALQDNNPFYSSFIEFSQMQRRTVIKKYSRNTRKINKQWHRLKLL